MNIATTSWPAWMYGPDGAAEIFNSEDEVPAGYHDHPSKVDGSAAADDDDEYDADAAQQYEDQTNAELVELLKTRDVEFSERWPKPKLVAALVKSDKEAK